MRHLDLFAGIGGFSLAARWMGWETVAHVEWDSYCQKILAKNFPDALRFGDIVEFNKMLQDGRITTDTESRKSGEQKTGDGWQNISRRSEKTHGQLSIGRIDILTGGFPCQPFSHAGKRKGVADERYLWPEMLRTIRILKPSFVVGENVAGLVSMENGKTLDSILADLENEGYQVESFIIPACAVGAWHRRDRIWIVGRRIFSNSVNGTNRTIRGESREKKGVSCECRQTRLSRKSCRTGGEIFPDCNNHGLQGREETRDAGGGRAKRNEQSERYRQCPKWENGQLESRLGGMAYGLPYWVDGYWDREPEGIPRVATGVKNRVDRLKGLGNAIVPQVAFQLFKAIEQFNNQ
jgi:DNA (cytosine-5)-methyltransferase 1